MLTKEEKYVLHVIKSSLNSDAPQLVDNLNHSEVARLIDKNGITSIVYNSLDPESKRLLATKYNIAIRQFVLQEHEGEEILKRLSNNGFDCIGLKGWELKDLYPDSIVRPMADLDILIKPYDFSKICEIMKSMGYSIEKKESSWMHDNFSKDGVTVETHKRLTDDSKEIKKWESEMWGRSVSIGENHIRRMTSEDYYIYHFIHLYKDFLYGSLGLRRIIDTWIIQQKLNIRMKEVQDVFGRLNILEFHNRIIKLSNIIMCGEEMDSDSEVLVKHSFVYGIYGTTKSYKAGRIVSMSSDSIKFGKGKSFITAVFLPYHRMKAHFPILYKVPILLPYFWIKRILVFIFGDIKSSINKLNYSDICMEDFEEMKHFFEAGGIN